jgi:hypothetical protein
MKDRRIEQHPFEFILRINGNIICQRYFNINNFNPDVLGSVEMKELLDRVAGFNNTWGTMGIIPNFLKERSCEYLQFFEDHPHLAYKNKDGEIKDIWETPDKYTFEIKIEDNIVGVIEFPANTFPPKIRYKVNMKHETTIWGDKVLDGKGSPKNSDMIPNIVREIKKTFTQKSYTTSYMGYPLDILAQQDKEYTNYDSTLSN